MDQAFLQVLYVYKFVLFSLHFRDEENETKWGKGHKASKWQSQGFQPRLSGSGVYALNITLSCPS